MNHSSEIPSRVSRVDPLTMFPGLDLIVSYASFKILTLERTSKALTYLPSGPCRRRERMISAGDCCLSFFIVNINSGRSRLSCVLVFLRRVHSEGSPGPTALSPLFPPLLTRASQPDVPVLPDSIAWRLGGGLSARTRE